MRALVLLAFAGIVSVSTVQAAEQAEEIVVTATRTDTSGIPVPTTISVIDRNEIESSGARTLTELMRTRAGVHVSDLFGDGSATTFDMRGFGAAGVSNTLVLVDGRPINNSSDIAPPDLTLVDLDNVERIEIIQGSAGTLYGNQAVGGLINIVTRSIPGGTEIRLGADLASFDEQQVRLRAGHRFKSGLALALRGRYREADNYRDHNESRHDNAGLRVEQNFSHGLVFLEHDYAKENTKLPGALFKDELNADRRQSESSYAKDYSLTTTNATRAGGAYSIARWLRLESEITERENDREFVNSYRGSAGSLSTQNRRVTTINPRIQLLPSCGSGRCQFTVGTDLEKTTYRLLSSIGPQYVDQSIFGYYGQAILPFAHGWSTTIGARYTAVRNDIYTGTRTQLDDNGSVGSAGVSWRPATGWRLFARADQNFRFAKVDEHTNPVSGQPVGLKTQTGTSYETGFEFARGRYLGRITTYELDLKNEIAFNGTSNNINLAQTQRYGTIIEGNLPLSRTVTASAAYTWTDGKVTDGQYEGNLIPLVPRWQSRLGLDWKFASFWFFRAEHQWVDKQVNGGDFSNSFEKLPRYAVTNLRIRYLKENLEIALAVNNLFDEHYSETGAIGYDATFTQRDAYFPSPGRNLRLTTQYAWR